jgi:hypothetical protein
MKNKILFIPSDTELEHTVFVEKPSSAKNYLPTWWKEQKLTLQNQNNEEFIPPTLSFKACMPFLDSLISGYMLTTFQDIYVSNTNGMQSLTWKALPTPLIDRDVSKTLPVPVGCSDAHFAWRMHFGVLVPKGYSILITHPLNRHDLPFVTSSGIIDEGVHWGGNFSFWLKKDFEGVIPKDTPYAQILPFKRENWSSELRKDLIEESIRKHREKSRYFSGFYKKFIRQEKKFE